MVRDFKGLVLASRSVLHTNVRSAFAAEGLACKELIRVCVDLRVETVTVEGDSLTVIKKCNSHLRDYSEIGRYIRDKKKSLFEKFHSIRFHHVCRLANKLADSIARKGLRSRNESYLFGDVSRFAAQIWRDDFLREPD